MIFREWKEQDILAIAELEKKCFEKDAWTQSAFISAFQSPAFRSVLVEEDGEIIAYGGITVAGDADIENVAVSPAHRRLGLGEKILQNLLQTAKNEGAENVFLEVRVSNAPAMQMYLKNGFVGIYARTRYYPDGEDCLIMKKSL